MMPMQILEVATSAITTSSDAYELCRKFVHSTLSTGNTVGSQIVAIDQRGNVREIASYGLVSAIDAELNLWDESSLSKSINQKKITSLESKDKYQIVIPFYLQEAPVGALILYSNESWDENALDDASERILAKWGAFYLETNGLQSRASHSSKVVRENELTSRQLDILSMMASGLTNAQIAKNLLVSESTIRQETVRIYRALGVESRVEASKKGKALGLIPKTGSTLGAA